MLSAPWLRPCAGDGALYGALLSACEAPGGLPVVGLDRLPGKEHGLPGKPYDARVRGLVGRENEEPVLGSLEGGTGSREIFEAKQRSDRLRARSDRIERQRLELAQLR
jgi:hypothetical protein